MQPSPNTTMGRARNGTTTIGFKDNKDAGAKEVRIGDGMESEATSIQEGVKAGDGAALVIGTTRNHRGVKSRHPARCSGWMISFLAVSEHSKQRGPTNIGTER